MTKQFELTDLLFVFTEQKSSPKLPKEFTVEIDDRGELYLQSLTNFLKTYSRVDKSALRKLEYGDTIVFTPKEVYVETDIRKASKLKLVSLSLVNDYNKVEKAVRNFFTNVFVGKSNDMPSCCKNCPFSTTCYKKDNTIIYDGEYISVEEKVSIMYNFVKVGYDQYDIITTYSGQQLVTIEDELFEVKKTRGGKKYLQLL